MNKYQHTVSLWLVQTRSFLTVPLAQSPIVGLSLPSLVPLLSICVCVCVSTHVCRGSVLSITARILQSGMGMTELLHLIAAKLLSESGMGFALTALKASVGLSLRTTSIWPTNKTLFVEECYQCVGLLYGYNAGKRHCRYSVGMFWWIFRAGKNDQKAC